MKIIQQNWGGGHILTQFLTLQTSNFTMTLNVLNRVDSISDNQIIHSTTLKTQLQPYSPPSKKFSSFPTSPERCIHRTKPLILRMLFFTGRASSDWWFANVIAWKFSEDVGYVQKINLDITPRTTRNIWPHRWRRRHASRENGAQCRRSWSRSNPRQRK